MPLHPSTALLRSTPWCLNLVVQASWDKGVLSNKLALGPQEKFSLSSA